MYQLSLENWFTVSCIVQYCTNVTTCLPGYYGGGQSIPAPQYYCNASTKYDTPDWFPIMCVIWENTGFIGYFYYSPSLITTLTNFSQVMNLYANVSSFRYIHFNSIQVYTFNSIHVHSLQFKESIVHYRFMIVVFCIYAVHCCAA